MARQAIATAALLLIIGNITPALSLSYVGCWPAAAFVKPREEVAASLTACEASCAESKLPLVGLVSLPRRWRPRLGRGGAARLRRPVHAGEGAGLRTASNLPQPARTPALSRRPLPDPPDGTQVGANGCACTTYLPSGPAVADALCASKDPSSVAVYYRFAGELADHVGAFSSAAPSAAAAARAAGACMPAHAAADAACAPASALRADPTKGCRLAPVPLAAEHWQAGGTGAQYIKFMGGDEVQLSLVQDRGPRWAAG
jgi:hypothetical protein